MAKISLNKLGLKKDNSINTIKVNEVEVEVKTYLPMSDKANIVEIVVQNSLDAGVINPMLVEQYLHLYMIYKYTNVSFTEAQRKDESELYDILEANAFIDEVINAIGEDYMVLRQYCEDYIQSVEKFSHSFYGTAIKFLNNIPEMANEILSSLDELDLSKLKETFDVATEFGGNEAATLEALLGQK